MSIEMAGGSWTYVAEARKRPHVHPLCSPSGAVLTRDAPPDHPWHHALWFTIKYVNEENFWEEQPPYGVLRHGDDLSTGDNSITGTLQWIRPDRETVVVTERRTLAHVPIDDATYAIDWSSTLVPHIDVLLDRTPFTTWGGYGGLAFRGRPDWTDTWLTVDGLDDDKTPERLTGQRGRWCDLTGTVDGGLAGVLFLDAADNPRHPVPWYASTRAATYGDEGWSNFLNAAFLWDSSLTLAAGDELAFRYRVVVHDGIWDRARCTAAWEDWHGATS